MTQLTKQAFREELNVGDYKHSHANSRYENRKRPYGDYLYFQDREKFNFDFEEWRQAKGQLATLDPKETQR